MYGRPDAAPVACRHSMIGAGGPAGD